MVKREELLNILKEEHCSKQLVNFVKQCKSDGDACVSEILESCSRTELHHIWQRVADVFTPILSQECTEAPGEDEVTADVLQEVRSVVQCLVVLLTAVVRDRHTEVTEEILSVAQLLQDMIYRLPSCDHPLKNSVAKVFEEWWRRELPHRDQLIVTAYMYVMARTHDLQPKPLIVDLKRVYALREVISLVDLETEESEDFKRMLQRCFISPLYVKNDEGVRFLSYVLGLDEDMMLSLHQVVKSNLPSVPRGWAERYGEVYFRTWQHLTGVTREILEEKCIQDLMYHGVRAQGALAATLHKLLGFIHHQKKQQGVDAMLYRLYKPFIWLFLVAPNCKVRENTATIFFEVFPLHNPEEDMQEFEAIVQKQFDCIMTLLKDPVPRIQALSVQGAFSVLRRFWDTVPKKTLTDLTIAMVTGLLSSSPSHSVRVNVVWGLKNLVNNPLTHPYMKTVLPTTMKSFHDTSDVVRVAMCDLLLKVKSVRAIKFWSIVPVDHLLARLVVDRQPVQRRIVKLLFENFIPLDSPSDEQMDRCLVLLQQNPEAFRQFYRHAPQYMDIKDTVTYICTVAKTILWAMKAESSAENDDEEEEVVRISNTPVMLGLCEVICILWNVIQPELDKASNAALKKDLHKKFTFSLPGMFEAFNDVQILAVLDKITGLLPASFVPAISGTWLPRLRRMTDGQNKDDYIAVIESLCLQGKVSYVLELATDWLTPSLTTDTGESRSTSKNKEGGKRKKVGFVEPRAPQPYLAIDILEYIFQNTITRQAVLQDRQELWALRDALKGCLPVLAGQLSSDTVTTTDKHRLLTSCLTMYCKLCIILHEKVSESSDSRQVCVGLAEWIQQHALPVLQVKEEEGGQEAEKKSTRRRSRQKQQKGSTLSLRKDLAYSVTECVLEMINNLLLVGQASPETCSKFIDFVAACITSDLELRVLPSAVLCLNQVVEVRRYCDDVERQTLGHWCSVPSTLSTLFFNVTRIMQQNPEYSAKLLKSSKGPLGSLLKALFEWSWREDFLAHETMTTIMSTMLAELVYSCQQQSFQEEATDSTEATAELPPLTQWLLDILQSQVAMIQCFVEVLIDACRSGNMSDFYKLHGVVIVLSVLTTGKKKLSILKELCTIVERQTEEQTSVLGEEEKGDNKGIMLAVESHLKQCQIRLNMVH